MHLLPRDQLSPEAAREANERWFSPAEDEPGEPHVADPSSQAVRVQRGRLGALRRYGVLAICGANIAVYWAGWHWAFYVGVGGVALFAAAHLGALVAARRAS